MTQELFGDVAPAEDGLLAAAMSVIDSRGNDAAAAAKLERAGWTSPLLGRVPAKTVMSDLPGVTSSPRVGGTVPEEIVRRVRERQQSAQALIDAVSVDLEYGERPWLPGVPVPPTTAGSPQSTEHGEITTYTISATGGGYATPFLLGAMTNISWQASTVQDAIMELMHERALYNTAQWIVGRLVAAAGAASATVLAAVGAVESAGWQPDLILTPLSRADRVAAALGTLTPAALDGLRIVIAPVGSRVLVASRAGLDIRVSERAQAMVSEPSIGGFEVSTVYWATTAIGAGAAKQVTA